MFRRDFVFERGFAAAIALTAALGIGNAALAFATRNIRISRASGSPRGFRGFGASPPSIRPSLGASARRRR
jgi:hypothetical protein